jgi:hypothetical protein
VRSCPGWSCPGATDGSRVSVASSGAPASVLKTFVPFGF